MAGRAVRPPKGPAYRTPTVDELRELEAELGGGAPMQATTGGVPTAEELAELDGAPVAPAVAPAPPDVSKTESVLRGAKQGATLGFGDELTGLGKALFEEVGGTLRGEDTRGTFAGKYRKARDEDRDADRAAREANPLLYMGGNLAGGIASSFVPGLNIARGASLGKAVAQGAKLGALSGAGESEAENLPGIALDAGMGGLIGGGTTGLVTRFLRGAPDRVVKRALGDITDGATSTQRDRVVGEAGSKVGDVIDILKDKSFKKAGRDSGRLLTATEDAISDVGQQLDGAFRSAGLTTPGIRVNDVQLALGKIVKELEADPGKRAVARAVRDQMDDVANAWITKAAPRDKFGMPVVTAEQVRVFASDVGDTAFRGSPAVAPKQGQAISQRIWGELKDLIGKNLDEAAQNGGPARAQIERLNKRMSTLLNMREAVRYRATREATESTRLKDRISGGLDMGLALADPSMFVAKKGYDIVGKPAFRALDDKLAQLVTAARNGHKPAQIAERAISLGVSPLVAKAMANWAFRSVNNIDGGGPVEATGP